MVLAVNADRPDPDDGARRASPDQSGIGGNPVTGKGGDVPDRFDQIGLALPALRHRVILNFEGEAEGITPEAIVRSILDSVPPPSVE